MNTNDDDTTMTKNGVSLLIDAMMTSIWWALRSTTRKTFKAHSL